MLRFKIQELLNALGRYIGRSDRVMREDVRSVIDRGYPQAFDIDMSGVVLAELREDEYALVVVHTSRPKRVAQTVGK